MTIQPVRPERDVRSIAQLILSGLSMGLSFVAAGLLFLVGLVGIFDSSTTLTRSSAIFSVAWITLLAGALAVPSLVFSIQRLRGAPEHAIRLPGFRLASILILIWPLILFFGNFVSGQPRLAWLLLPPIQLLAVGLPIWWVLEIARRSLRSGSQQRDWGLLNFSVFLTMPFVMVAEIGFLLILVLLFAIWASSQPELLNNLQILAQRLMSSQPNPESIMALVLPYLRNPLVIFAALAIMAGVIPLVEELFKPLAIWALAGRRLTPAEGFVAGAICGASFALVENLFYMSNPLGSNWAFLAAGRAGTALLHITTTSMVGWALASAWRDGTYIRLGLFYLLAALLHGLWNAFGVLAGFSAILSNAPAGLDFLVFLVKAAPVGIVISLLGLFLLLWSINRSLRLSAAVEPASISLMEEREPDRPDSPL